MTTLFCTGSGECACEALVVLFACDERLWTRVGCSDADTAVSAHLEEKGARLDENADNRNDTEATSAAKLYCKHAMNRCVYPRLTREVVSCAALLSTSGHCHHRVHRCVCSQKE